MQPLEERCDDQHDRIEHAGSRDQVHQPDGVQFAACRVAFEDGRTAGAVAPRSAVAVERDAIAEPQAEVPVRANGFTAGPLAKLCTQATHQQPVA